MVDQFDIGEVESPETGLILREVTGVEVPSTETLKEFIGASVTPFSDEQRGKLEQKIPDEEIEILPTGEVYASQVRYRRILNEAFGAGGWAMVPRGQWYQDGNTLCREFWLMAEGRFVSASVGEAEFQPDNKRMSRATALEAVKSNALMRCCKDLLVASQCWDKRWIREWKKEWAVAVWCANKKNPSEKKLLWRRKDDDLFEYPWVEQGEKKPARKATAPAPEDETQETADEPLADATAYRNERYMKAINAERKRVGDEAFNRILGTVWSVTKPEEILNWDDRKKFYEALRELSAEKEA